MALFILLLSIPLVTILCFISIIQFWKFPIYCQKRGLCLDSKLFTIYKIRTLNCQAGVYSNGITLNSELSDYLTKYTRWLRRTGLDELPQLLNVVLGDMSFIGPRPLSIKDLRLFQRLYPQLYKERRSLQVRPGITGMWQVYGKREYGIQEMTRLDEYYQENKCPKLNAAIIIVTMIKILTAGKSDAADINSLSAGKIKLIQL